MALTIEHSPKSFGSWRVIRKIGEGAQGEVYLVEPQSAEQEREKSVSVVREALIQVRNITLDLFVPARVLVDTLGTRLEGVDRAAPNTGENASGRSWRCKAVQAGAWPRR